MNLRTSCQILCCVAIINGFCEKSNNNINYLLFLLGLFVLLKNVLNF